MLLAQRTACGWHKVATYKVIVIVDLTTSSEASIVEGHPRIGEALLELVYGSIVACRVWYHGSMGNASGG